MEIAEISDLTGKGESIFATKLREIDAPRVKEIGLGTLSVYWHRRNSDA